MGIPCLRRDNSDKQAEEDLEVTQFVAIAVISAALFETLICQV